MLDFFKSVVFFLGCISSCFWSPLNANPLIVLAAQEDPVDVCNYHAELISECKDVQSLIELLFELRRYVLSLGYEFPRLTTILEASRQSMIKDGIEIDQATFDALKQEFEAFERAEQDCRSGIQQIKHKHHHKKHKKDKEVKISSKMATGFLKFVGGTLLCIIPVPAIQGAGASLAIVGVSEMVDAARHESDKKEWEDRMDANRRVDASLTDTP